MTSLYVQKSKRLLAEEKPTVAIPVAAPAAAVQPAPAAAAAEALLQVREQRKNPIEIEPASRGDARRQHQVFAHVETRENPALLRADGDAEPRDALGRQPDGLFPLEFRRALALGDDAHDGFQRRRLARAVAPEQGYDFAGTNVEIDAMQNVRFAVPGL